MTLSQIFLAVLGAGGGGALIALGVVRAFGEKWLDSKFAGRLQDLRHEHERQMESVRLEASRLLDRSTRLTEREFDVSAEAWSLVYEAYVQTMSALPGFKQQPDLSRASDEIARHVANGAGLDEFEVEQLMSRQPNDRNSYFGERIDAHQLWDARKASRDASRYLAKKALFLEQDVHERLTEFVDEAWNAIVDWELVKEMRGSRGALIDLRRADEAFRNGGATKIKELEHFVRARFWGTAD